MIQLKCKAAKFGESNGLPPDLIPVYLLEIDRLKRKGDLLDFEILVKAWRQISPEYNAKERELSNQENSFKKKRAEDKDGIEEESKITRGKRGP